jgi:hypothetical protein
MVKLRGQMNSVDYAIAGPSGTGSAAGDGQSPDRGLRGWLETGLRVPPGLSAVVIVTDLATIAVLKQ